MAGDLRFPSLRLHSFCLRYIWAAPLPADFTINVRGISARSLPRFASSVLHVAIQDHDSGGFADAADVV
jgi:hypothetical protein